MFKFYSLFFLTLLVFVEINGQSDSATLNTALVESDTVKVTKSKDQTILTWGNKNIILLEDTIKKIPEFTLSLGFNFDFLDGVQTNDLYADVNADIPFIFLPKKVTSKPEEFINQIGLEVGAYQLRTISNLEDTVTVQYRLTEPIVENGSLVGINYITANTANSSVISRENIGLFVQPKWIFHFAESGEYLSRISLIGHCEWYKSDIKLDYTFSDVISRDTSLMAPEDWPRPFNTVEEIPSFESSIRQENLINLGAGVDILVKRPSGILQFKSVFGVNSITVTDNPNGIISDLEVSTSANRRRFFYIVQAEFIERKLLGLKLSAEVRGFGAPDLSNIVGRVADLPQFSIALSKQFNLEKIADLFSVD